MIKWYYQYINGCSEIKKEEIIDLNPDKFGRWLIYGYVISDFFDVPIKVATINRVNGIYYCETTMVNKSLGIHVRTKQMNTPREMMDMCQKEFTDVANFFNSLV